MRVLFYDVKIVRKAYFSSEIKYTLSVIWEHRWNWRV